MGDRGANDLVLDHQVLGPELSQARVLDELVAGDPERPDGKLDLQRRRMLAVPGSTAGVLVNEPRRACGDGVGLAPVVTSERVSQPRELLQLLGRELEERLVRLRAESADDALSEVLRELWRNVLRPVLVVHGVLWSVA